MSQAIIPICEHIRDNNTRCGSPAMDGFHFCFYHARLNMPPLFNGKREIRVSALESAQSLQITLTHVTQAILDDEIPPAKAYALVQVLQLGCRAIAMNQDLLGGKVMELPASMAHLLEQPKNRQAESEEAATNAAADSEEYSAPSVPKKKPRMTEQEFEPWRQILFAGTSHPQYLQALEKYDEYTDGFEKLPEADSA